MIAKFDGRITVDEEKALLEVVDALKIEPHSWQRAWAIATRPSHDASTQLAGQDAGSVGQMGCFTKVALIALGVAVFSGVLFSYFNYQAESVQYAQGYAEYSSGNCREAVALVLRFTEGRVLDFTAADVPVPNDFMHNALEIVRQCTPLVDAAKDVQAGHLSSGLLHYYAAANGREPQFIKDIALQRMHSLAEQSRPQALVDLDLCQKLPEPQMTSLFTTTNESLQDMRLLCGHAFSENGRTEDALAYYLLLAKDFSGYTKLHEVNDKLPELPEACEHTQEILAIDYFHSHPENMQSFYLACAQRSEQKKQYAAAVRLLEEFSAAFPGRSEAKDVQEVLARNLFLKAQAERAPEIAAPEMTGSTAKGISVVLIQNDSPEGMRVSFSGPQSAVEKIDSCSDCTTYLSPGPLECPELGPSGIYTLTPGTYNVVVESTTDDKVQPYKGRWTLKDGAEYGHCFYIVTSRRK
jgi:hypothetical protein